MFESNKPDSRENDGKLVSNDSFTRERPFICCYDDCNKSYTKQSHLKRHEDIHGNGYQCTEKNCNQKFKSKSTLKKHVDNVHLKKNPKKYKCSECNQEFNKHNWLTRHQFKHSGVKPYECPKEGCEKRFLVPSKLKRHLKVHEGYTCPKENCGQKFFKWTLYVKHFKNSHPTIHRCHYCEKIFSTSSNLKAHLEVHEFDRKVFLCPKPNCSRFYFMKRNLNHHLKAYHEKRTFVCTKEHCYKAFKSEKDLNAHISRHDPKKRSRKKKKSNPKPSFAARLAGCVPPKILPKRKNNEETEVESCEENLTSEGKHRDLPDTNPIENNQEEFCLLNNSSDFLNNSYDGSLTVLNLKEKMLERKTFCSKNTIECISA